MLLQRSRIGPEASFPSRYERATKGALKPGRLARVLARARASTLNGALAAGRDPTCSPLLAARALQLTSPRSRASLAGGLDLLLRCAQAPPSRWRARGRRDAVCANASALGELAALVAGTSPLYVRGVAALEQLLSDGTSPAYRGDPETLARRLRECRWGMTGSG
jgi:hypothetical protein